MVLVRETEQADAAAITAGHAASVRGLAADHYDDEQVASWSDSAEDDFSPPDGGVQVVVAETAGSGGSEAGGRDQWVRGGRPRVRRGPGRLRPPDHAGEGVGSAILRELDGRARDEGLADLHLAASLTAVPFYERHGWKSTEPTAYELEGGVELEAVEMEKSL